MKDCEEIREWYQEHRKPIEDRRTLNGRGLVLQTRIGTGLRVSRR